MNKRCPYLKNCKAENEKIDELFRFECPPKPYKECVKFGDYEYEEKQNAISIDSRVASKH